MGGQRGQRGQKGTNSLIRAEQWGVRVRGARMDQIPKFVLNNGGSKGVRRPELRGPEKSGK